MADYILTERRYDIDWLRVIAFGLLILFHVAIGFVPKSVYPYVNKQTAGVGLSILLLFVHQWRLPILFFISGMGTSFAFRKRTGGQFVVERLKRLIIPLLFAMNFVVVFQGYFAELHRVQGLAEMLPSYPGGPVSLSEFALGWWSHFGEIQHLWFLINLFGYSMLCIPLFVYLRNRSEGKVMKTAGKILNLPKGLGLLFVFPIPLILVELTIKPWAYGIVGRGYELPWYLWFFVCGYIFIRAGDRYWQALDRARYLSLVLGIVSSVLLFLLMVAGNRISPGYGSLLLNGGWLRFGDTFLGPLTVPACILHGLNSWFWSIVFFSWGAKLLNKSSRLLAYLNRTVYPFYIVHMTFCLLALYYLKDVALYWPLKLILIAVITFGGCWITFEIVKRNKVTRMLFGIKSFRSY